jgi:hypothetical protein
MSGVLVLGREPAKTTRIGDDIISQTVAYDIPPIALILLALGEAGASRGNALQLRAFGWVASAPLVLPQGDVLGLPALGDAFRLERLT